MLATKRSHWTLLVLTPLIYCCGCGSRIVHITEEKIELAEASIVINSPYICIESIDNENVVREIEGKRRQFDERKIAVSPGDRAVTIVYSKALTQDHSGDRRCQCFFYKEWMPITAEGEHTQAMHRNGQAMGDLVMEHGELLRYDYHDLYINPIHFTLEGRKTINIPTEPGHTYTIILSEESDDEICERACGMVLLVDDKLSYSGKKRYEIKDYPFTIEVVEIEN